MNFPTPIPDSDSYSSALLGLLLSSDTTVCPAVRLSLHLEILNRVAATVSINFLLNSQGHTLFHLGAFDYSCAD